MHILLTVACTEPLQKLVFREPLLPQSNNCTIITRLRANKPIIKNELFTVEPSAQFRRKMLVKIRNNIQVHSVLNKYFIREWCHIFSYTLTPSFRTPVIYSHLK